MDEQLENGLPGALASIPVPPDLLQRLQGRLDAQLPHLPDPRAAAERLRQFIAASRSPTALLAFFDRDETAPATLLRLLSIGNRVANQLIADPESFDLIRAGGGSDVAREVLLDEIMAELEAVAGWGGGWEAAGLVLKSVVGRERLRIAYAEFLTGASPARVADQLCILAEVVIEAAVHYSARRIAERYGVPRTPAGEPAALSVIGLGAFGARELGYDSTLELMFLCDHCGPSDGAVNLPGEEYFRRLGYAVIALAGGDVPDDRDVFGEYVPDQPPVTPPQSPLSPAARGEREQAVPLHGRVSSFRTGSEPAAERGRLFEISIARRPLGPDGPIVTTVTEAHRHYQLAGRTWERLLHLNSRVVAGDSALGESFLDLIRPWVFRRYLQHADQEGLQLLVRKFKRRMAGSSSPAQVDGAPGTADESASSGDGAVTIADVRCRVGGLWDIESIVGLLQLISGGEVESLRVRGTADAVQSLLAAGLLTVQEAALLSEHHHLLTRCEHCIQLDGPGDLGELIPEDSPAHDAAVAARHLGYVNAEGRGDASRLADAIKTACDLNRRTIQRLITDADIGADEMRPETELMLDPEPDAEFIEEVLATHGLSRPEVAMQDLQRLVVEPVPFLSSRRCRHFFAEIAPELLGEVARTPDPHETLATLAQVSDSLGGKAVLWELFRTSPAAMHLFVRLCACGPYPARLLVRYPGMIDELVDSLILDRLPGREWLEASSIELCRSTGDLRGVLRNFKTGAHLQIGVRDCLSKETLEATHAALAATAESVLRRTAESVIRSLGERYGDPVSDEGRPAELIILALGKLGGREPNYHSDLEVIFLYDAEGRTRRRVGGHRNTISNAEFFHQAAAQIVRFLNDAQDGDPLYEVGAPLPLRNLASRYAAGPAEMPAGDFTVESRDAVCLSLANFTNHFHRGQAMLPQRLAILKARAASGAETLRTHVDSMVREAILAGEWYPSLAAQVQRLREDIEASAGSDNLKRGCGGTVDIELITQTLQLCHARRHPEILVPGTSEALAKIADLRLIDPQVAATLREHYRTLREVELKIRLLDAPARHEIPRDPLSLSRLAMLMQRPSADEIIDRCRDVRSLNRQIFNDLLRNLS